MQMRQLRRSPSIVRFRPLPGTLYSNMAQRNVRLQVVWIVSVPFRGSFIQINQNNEYLMNIQFPSPSGDSLFKWCKVAQGYVQRVSGPFRGSFIQINLSVGSKDHVMAFPSPFGDPLFKYYVCYIKSYPEGQFPSPSGDPLFK